MVVDSSSYSTLSMRKVLDFMVIDGLILRSIWDCQLIDCSVMLIDHQSYSPSVPLLQVWLPNLPYMHIELLIMHFNVEHQVIDSLISGLCLPAGLDV